MQQPNRLTPSRRPRRRSFWRRRLLVLLLLLVPVVGWGAWQTWQSHMAPIIPIAEAPRITAGQPVHVLSLASTIAPETGADPTP